MNQEARCDLKFEQVHHPRKHKTAHSCLYMGTELRGCHGAALCTSWKRYITRVLDPWAPDIMKQFFKLLSYRCRPNSIVPIVAQSQWRMVLTSPPHISWQPCRMWQHRCCYKGRDGMETMDTKRDIKRCTMGIEVRETAERRMKRKNKECTWQTPHRKSSGTQNGG